MLSPFDEIVKQMGLQDPKMLKNISNWARSSQIFASDKIIEYGLPTRRDEYWSYTRPDPFLAPKAPINVNSSKEIDVFSNLFGSVINYKNGLLETNPLPSCSDYSVESLDQSVRMKQHWASTVYGKLEAKGQEPVRRSLAALNTATASQGIFLRAKKHVEKPVVINAIFNNDTDAMIHHVIKVEPGAEITLSETGNYGARSNVVLEIEVADRGKFNHIRIQSGDQNHTISHIFGKVGTNSIFKSFTFSSGGTLTRNECILDLIGEGSSATVAGTCIGDKGFQHDDTVFVTHHAAGCESRQVFKKVLGNGAVGVFQGKILVKENAQKTDGYQISQSLLLDDDGQFLAKPELEIYADDVACSHGSTSGAIDEQALFYLRSRGVPKAKAVDLLILSFMAEAIEEVEEPLLAEALLQYLTSVLATR